MEQDVSDSSLETRPSPSSTRACSVSYNYAWEYFRRELYRRPGTFYHVMRAAIYVELRLPLEAAILSSRCGYGRPDPTPKRRRGSGQNYWLC